MRASSDDTRVECQTYGLTDIGATVNDRGVFCEPLRESGGMHPQEILKSEGFKAPFPALSDQ